MRALHFTGPNSASLVEVDDPLRGATEALVAPRYVGLCGTDLELFNGSMPYFGQNEASYPIQPGHEVAGIVVESPEGGLAPGTGVMIDPVVGCGSCGACLEGIQTRCSARRELGIRRGMPGAACELIAVPHSNLHAVPDGVELREAVLAEPGVTVLNAIDRIGDSVGRRALIVGSGTLGLIAAQLLRSRGADVDVAVIDRSRMELIERLGAHPVERPADGAYPIVLEAAGAPAAVRQAFEAVSPGGRIAIAGVQPAPVPALDVNHLVLKDVTVYGVINGSGLYDRMLAELQAGSVDASVLIDQEFDLGEAHAALAALPDPRRPAPKLLLRI